MFADRTVSENGMYNGSGIWISRIDVEFLVSTRSIDCTVYLLKVGLTFTSSSSFLLVGCLEVWYRGLDIF